MALQLGLLHDALKAAGVGYDSQLTGVRFDIAGLRAHVDQQFVQLRADFGALRAYVDHRFNLLRWTIGVNSALVPAIPMKLFVH